MPQPPQPPQPTPHRQALHPQPPQPRQPPHPRKPPHPRQPPHPRASCTPLRTFSSSSKRRKVARLTSAISSSPSVIIMPGAKFRPCWTSPVGTADADAPPASEKVNPAAPNAGTAVLVTRFLFEACFTRGMVASSNVARRISVRRSYADQIRRARFMHTRKCNDARSDCIHVHERSRRIFVDCNDSPRPSRGLQRVRLGAVRNHLQA
jgi:hypothetical protein